MPALILGLLPLLAGNAPAQTPPLAPPPEAHQFDFWVGEWDVINPAGKLVGTSRIERVAASAGLLESWTGAGGYTGRSLNAWNAVKMQWQQFWVGSDGGVLELSGGLVNGRMVLAAERVVNGARRIERITWTPNANGTVRQHWEQSAEGGQTWMTVFDGLYRKRD